MLWNELIGWTDLALFLAMYAVSTAGITVGFHRLLTHRAFQTYKPIEYLFVACGSMAVEGPVIGCASRACRGPRAGRARTSRPPRRWDGRQPAQVRSLFGPIVVLGLPIPFGLGWLITGGLAGGLTALFWAGLVRIFLVHHVTFSINSICHFFGRRRFTTEDQSTNVFWLALPSFGESWHHNHHAFPRSALHGLRWWEVDPGGERAEAAATGPLAAAPAAPTRLADRA
jgi:stearoyl-CoA desaturase (Delta-9 desaturase)